MTALLVMAALILLGVIAVLEIGIWHNEAGFYRSINGERVDDATDYDAEEEQQ